jgi:predicted O-methyltransferase YrrM
MVNALKRAAAFFVPHGIVMIRDARRISRWREDMQEMHSERSSRLASVKDKAKHQRTPYFDYEAGISFLAERGCDPAQIREGSMSAESLGFAVHYLREMIGRKQCLGLHVGSFVGMSLAFFARAASQEHTESVVVSIDPDVPHRNIENTQRHAIALLNFFNLQRNVVWLTGYSLEKSISNDGIIFDEYDPEERFGAELSCEAQLSALRLLAPEKFDFAVIDGNHDADYLRREIECMNLLLKPGAILVLDDVSWQWPELQSVFNALDTTCYQKIGTDGRVGVLQKTSSAVIKAL